MDRWKMYCGGTWVLSPEGEFPFWTPFPFRHMRNTLIIGNCLKIDFSNFVHGDEWVKCREPLQSIKTRGGQGMEVIGDEGVIPHHFSMQIYFSLLPDTHHRYTVIYHLHPHFIILLFFCLRGLALASSIPYPEFWVLLLDESLESRCGQVNEINARKRICDTSVNGCLTWMMDQIEYGRQRGTIRASSHVKAHRQMGSQGGHTN